MTHNFIVPKAVLEQLKFREDLSGYGHEDTFFGYQLLKHDKRIVHIDNVVVNDQVVENAIYLSQMDESLLNLRRLLISTNYDPEFIDQVKLLRYYFQSGRMNTVMRMICRVFTPLIRIILEQGMISLTLLDCYKFGQFAKLETD